MLSEDVEEFPPGLVDNDGFSSVAVDNPNEGVDWLNRLEEAGGCIPTPHRPLHMVFEEVSDDEEDYEAMDISGDDEDLYCSRPSSPLPTHMVTTSFGLLERTPENENLGLDELYFAQPRLDAMDEEDDEMDAKPMVSLPRSGSFVSLCPRKESPPPVTYTRSHLDLSNDTTDHGLTRHHIKFIRRVWARRKEKLDTQLEEDPYCDEITFGRSKSYGSQHPQDIEPPPIYPRTGALELLHDQRFADVDQALAHLPLHKLNTTLCHHLFEAMSAGDLHDIFQPSANANQKPSTKPTVESIRSKQIEWALRYTILTQTFSPCAPVPDLNDPPAYVPILHNDGVYKPFPEPPPVPPKVFRGTIGLKPVFKRPRSALGVFSLSSSELEPPRKRCGFVIGDDDDEDDESASSDDGSYSEGSAGSDMESDDYPSTPTSSFGSFKVRSSYFD